MIQRYYGTDAPRSTGPHPDQLSDEIEAIAREIAKEQGHRDADHIIVCTDGARLPVWKFYIEVAKLYL